jgi:hypothetical protein
MDCGCRGPPCGPRPVARVRSRFRKETGGRAVARMNKRRFPPPWTIDEINNARFIVHDKNGLQLGYFYCEQEPGRRTAAGLLTKDQARRRAANFAKLPELLRKQ